MIVIVVIVTVIGFSYASAFWPLLGGGIYVGGVGICVVGVGLAWGGYVVIGDVGLSRFAYVVLGDYAGGGGANFWTSALPRTAALLDGFSMGRLYLG